MDSLAVCKKLELTTSGAVHGTAEANKAGKTSPPLFRECLLPGMETHFYLTLDQQLAGSLLSLDVIRQVLLDWYAVQRHYEDQFDWASVPLHGMALSDVPLILGGGVGFQSKSLIYKRMGREQATASVHKILKAQFWKTYKPWDGDPAPYRMKIVQVGGKFYPMGRCTLKVEEA